MQTCDYSVMPNVLIRLAIYGNMSLPAMGSTRLNTLPQVMKNGDLWTYQEKILVVFILLFPDDIQFFIYLLFFAHFWVNFQYLCYFWQDLILLWWMQLQQNQSNFYIPTVSMFLQKFSFSPQRTGFQWISAGSHSSGWQCSQIHENHVTGNKVPHGLRDFILGHKKQSLIRSLSKHKMKMCLEQKLGVTAESAVLIKHVLHDSNSVIKT